MLDHLARIVWPIAIAVLALFGLIFFGVIAATTSLLAALGVMIVLAGLATLVLGDTKRSIMVVVLGVALLLAHYAAPHALTVGTTSAALGWSP